MMVACEKKTRVMTTAQVKNEVPKKKILLGNCMLCRCEFNLGNAHDHMQGLGHHRKLKAFKGRDYAHECQACAASFVGLYKYKLHISTPEHKSKTKMLVLSRKKPFPLEKYLDKETLTKIRERNKKLRLKEKKEKNKKRKLDLRQAAAEKSNPKSQTPKQQNQKQQKTAKLEKTQKQPTKPASKQPQQKVQNKENRRAGKLRGPLSGQQIGDQPSQSERHHYNVQTQAIQSTSSQREGWDISMAAGSQDYLRRGPKDPRGAKAVAPDQSTWSHSSQVGYSSSYSSSGPDKDFAGVCKYTAQDSGEHLPSTDVSIPRLKDDGSGPIRGEDVHEMLCNVRRALQTKKRCKVEACGSRDQFSQVKEGRGRGKQMETDAPAHSSAASVCSRSLSSAGVPSVQSQQVSTSNSAPAKGARLSQRAEKTARGGPLVKQETAGDDTQLSAVGANEIFDSCAPWGRDGESQEGAPPWNRHGTLVLPASLSRHMSKAGPQPEPNLNAARRVRSVGGTRKGEGEKEAGLKPTLQKLLSSAGSQRKVNWREMYQEADRKKQEKVKGMPRFGIEMVSSLSEPDGFTMDAGEEDIPLAEGFQWESTHLDPPPAAPHPQTTPAPERPSEAQIQSAERPKVASRAKRCAAPVSVKVEPEMDANGDGRLDHGAGDGQSGRKVKKKRKAMYRPGGVANDAGFLVYRPCSINNDEEQELPGVSGLNPSGKKSKNDQIQVDQLLAVSLKEEELSKSMQTVDGSLIQARNALQAAYTEVQRLLLVKQQVTDEINSLRAKRIEILQGMQGGQNPLPHPLSPYISTTPSPPISALTASLPAQNPVHPSSPSVANPNHHHPASILSNRAMKQEAVFPHGLDRSSLSQHVLRNSLQMPATPSNPASVSLSLPAAPLPRQQRLKVEKKSKMSDSSSTASDSEEDPEGPGDDCSIKMVGTASASSMEVVAIEDSDAEDVPEAPAGGASSHNRPTDPSPAPSWRGTAFPPEPPESASAVSSSSTQTFTPLMHIKGVKVKEDPHDRAAPAEDEEPSLGRFLGHTGPIHGLQIHAGLLYTCSGDNTARAYSLVSRECQAVFTGHTNKINCLLVSSLPGLPARLYTGSSDETIRCYSIKSQKCLEQISLPDRVLCLHIAWNILYVGLANGFVVSFDLKTQRQLDVFECHCPRGVSCLASSQEGARRVLLVGSYDSTISVRDAKSSLLLRTLQGHTKTVLCTKVVNDLVFSGSSDTSVHAHNIHTGELVRIYKGHTHAVTAVAILGKVMVTACLDKLVRVYELQSHDRLQVYGGHSDMVMCMAIHKSLIYTGCYDGTVQAVKLNLMENYRCWWHGCCLIFGVMEHLLQHLLSDHSNPHQQTVKCRWRDCDAFFTSKNSSQKELPGHMQTHVEKDSKLDT